MPMRICRRSPRSAWSASARRHGSPAGCPGRRARPGVDCLRGRAGTEQRHDPIARVLVDRALEAVHLAVDALEAAVDDVVPDLPGSSCSARVVKPAYVSEQDGDLARSPSRR